MIFKKNFHQIDSYLTDNVMRLISSSDWKVLSSINRFLIGWHKTQDFITLKKIEEHTGLSVNTISTSLNNLSKYKIITVSLVYKAGFYHQEIKLNLNTEEYVLPEKLKLSKKVSNFFNNNKAEKTVQKFNNNRIIISQPSQGLRQLETENNNSTISSFDTVLSQDLKQSTISRLETYNKDINIKTNLNTYIHKNTEENVMNDFNNFSNNALEEIEHEDNFYNENTENKKITQISKGYEVKNDIEDILVNFGINKSKVINFQSIISLPKNVIMENIEKVNHLYSEGKCKSKSGLLLIFLNKVIEENKTNNIINTKNEGSYNSNQNTKLVNEDAFIQYFSKKRYIQSSGLPNALEIACGMLGFISESKERMNDFKLQGFTKEQIQMFIDKNKKADIFFYKRISQKQIETFFEIFDNPEILENKKVNNLTQKSLVDSLFSKTNSLKNLTPKNNELEEDFIPCY